VLLPVGEHTKGAVRAEAARLGLRTADKPDSQDVCFITATGGRHDFLVDRMTLHPGRVVDASGAQVGLVDAVELVTVGQRRGLGASGGGPRYAVAIDVASATVELGSADDLLTDSVGIDDLCWVDTPVAPGTRVAVQAGAHGRPRPATFTGDGATFITRHPRVAPGQSVVLYDGEYVLGGGIAR
jgi:tRNA-specific 2-thiouridylase